MLRTLGYVLCLLLLADIIVGQTCPNSCSGHGSCSSSGCLCQSGWGGSDCSLHTLSIVPNSAALTGQSVAAGQFLYYMFSTSATENIVVNVTQTATSGDCDVYVQVNSYPTFNSYTARDVSSAVVSIVSIPRAQQGTWYVGVYGYQACQYSIRLTASVCPNACSSHGSCSTSTGLCTCNNGYAGSDCSMQIVALSTSSTVTASVVTGAANYYSFTPPPSTSSILFTMQQTTSGDADIYISANVLPTNYVFDFANLTDAALSTVRITSVPNGAIYFIKVYGYTGCTYTLRVSIESTGHGTCTNNCSLHGSCSGSTCTCRSGFAGTDCNEMTTAFSLGSTVTGFVGDNAWNYYHIQAFTSNSLVFSVVQTDSDSFADCDMYLRAGAKPSRSMYDYVDFSSANNFSITISSPGNSVWYVGLYGWYPCTYSLTIADSAACSCLSGSDGALHGSCRSGSTACFCDAGWSGPACNQRSVALGNGVGVPSGSIGINAWNYYTMTTRSSYFQVAIKETNTIGFLWLFVSTAGPPSLLSYDDADQTPSTSIHYAQFAYESPQFLTYYIGVYGSTFIGSTSTTVPYQIVAWASPN